MCEAQKRKLIWMERYWSTLSEAEREARRFPLTLSEQLKSLPPFEERKRSSLQLRDEIAGYLDGVAEYFGDWQGVCPKFDFFYRAKTDEGITRKVAYRYLRSAEFLKEDRWNYPIMDILGVRVVVISSLIESIDVSETIASGFGSLMVFPWGTTGIRKLGGRNNRRSNKERKDYSAIHVNFGYYGQFAEVQVMVFNEWKDNEESREWYERSRIEEMFGGKQA